MNKQHEAARQCKPALLFEACPKCAVGDLLVYHHDEGCTVRCVQCGFAGKLLSTYPLKASGTKQASAAPSMEQGVLNSA